MNNVGDEVAVVFREKYKIGSDLFKTNQKYQMTKNEFKKLNSESLLKLTQESFLANIKSIGYEKICDMHKFHQKYKYKISNKSGETETITGIRYCNPLNYNNSNCLKTLVDGFADRYARTVFECLQKEFDGESIFSLFKLEIIEEVANLLQTKSKDNLNDLDDGKKSKSLHALTDLINYCLTCLIDSLPNKCVYSELESLKEQLKKTDISLSFEVAKKLLPLLQSLDIEQDSNQKEHYDLDSEDKYKALNGLINLIKEKFFLGVELDERFSKRDNLVAYRNKDYLNEIRAIKEEQLYNYIVKQNPDLTIFFDIDFLYKKFVLDKSPNVFKTSFINWIKKLDKEKINFSALNNNFFTFFTSVCCFDNEGNIVKLDERRPKNTNDILWGFTEFFYQKLFSSKGRSEDERKLKISGLDLICECIKRMDSEYITQKLFSGQAILIYKIYDFLFEDGEPSRSSEKIFWQKTSYKDMVSSIHSKFFKCLISQLKYKADYKDKFFELCCFGNCKNYYGRYIISNWGEAFELIRFADPNFVRDNIKDELVQDYLRYAKNKKEHEDYLKKIIVYDKNFSNGLDERQYFLELIKLGYIKYVDTKFICENINDDIVKENLKFIDSVDKSHELFNHFYEIYKENKNNQKIGEILDMIMQGRNKLLKIIDAEFIVENFDKKYVKDEIDSYLFNVYQNTDIEQLKKIYTLFYNRYKTLSNNEKEKTAKQRIVSKVSFLIEKFNRLIDYVDAEFIVENFDTHAIYSNIRYITDSDQRKKIFNLFYDKYKTLSYDNEGEKNQKNKIKKNILLLGRGREDFINSFDLEFIVENFDDLDIKSIDDTNKQKELYKYFYDVYKKTEINSDEKEKTTKRIWNLIRRFEGFVDNVDADFIVENWKDFGKFSGWPEENRGIYSNVIKNVRDYLDSAYLSSNEEVDLEKQQKNKKQIILWIDRIPDFITDVSEEFISENLDNEAIQKQRDYIGNRQKKMLYIHIRKHYGGEEQKNKILVLIEKYGFINYVSVEFIAENLDNETIQKECDSFTDGKRKDLYNHICEHYEGEEQKNKILVLIEKYGFINSVGVEFIAEHLDDKKVSGQLCKLTHQNKQSLCKYICTKYTDVEQKNKILTLMGTKSYKIYIPEKFLYNNFQEESVKEYVLYIFNDILGDDREQKIKNLWQNLYECYLKDQDNKEKEEKILAFLKIFKNAKDQNNYSWKYHWGDTLFLEMNAEFIADHINIIKDILYYYGDGKSQTKLENVCRYLCEEQKKYESKQTGKDRTNDILQLIDKFNDTISYIDPEFIYKNFDEQAVRNKLEKIIMYNDTLIKQLCDIIKTKSEEEIQKYFSVLIESNSRWSQFYIGMDWIYKNFDSEVIQKHLNAITDENLLQLYACINKSQNDDNKKKDHILRIVETHPESIKFLCTLDAEFILENLDNPHIQNMIKNCLKREGNNNDCYSDYDFSSKGWIQRYALRKLICAIELTEDKSEKAKFYSSLLNILENSSNIFRCTSAKFIRECADVENKTIKEYIQKNISVGTYNYEYGLNAEDVKKTGDIKYKYDSIGPTFLCIRKDNEDNVQFFKEALKLIESYKISNLSSLISSYGDILLENIDNLDYISFIEEYNKYYSNKYISNEDFFAALLYEYQYNKDKDIEWKKSVAMKLIKSNYFCGSNENHKNSCWKFFGYVLVATKVYDNKYYEDFVCKLIDKNPVYVATHINKKFLMDNFDKYNTLKEITKKAFTGILGGFSGDNIYYMLKNLDCEKERDKKIILELVSFAPDRVLKFVSDEFIVDNLDNEYVKEGLSSLLEECFVHRLSGDSKIKRSFGKLLACIENKQGWTHEQKKAAKLKLILSGESQTIYRLSDFIIENWDNSEIQKTLKECLASKETLFETILNQIKEQKDKNGWNDKRKEDAILKLISYNYKAAVCYIDIEFLINHPEGKLAIKNQIFCNNSAGHETEDHIFNRILKYLTRQTEINGWDDVKKKNLISDLILNGEGKYDDKSKLIALNLDNDIVQEFMKDHLKDDDRIFRNLINYLNEGYSESKDSILYLISLDPEFVIDYVHPQFLFNKREEDLVQSGLKKYNFDKKTQCSDFVINLILCNSKWVTQDCYLEFLIDNINNDNVSKLLEETFNSKEKHEFAVDLFKRLDRIVNYRRSLSYYEEKYLKDETANDLIIKLSLYNLDLAVQCLSADSIANFPTVKNSELDGNCKTLDECMKKYFSSQEDNSVSVQRFTELCNQLKDSKNKIAFVRKMISYNPTLVAKYLNSEVIIDLIIGFFPSKEVIDCLQKYFSENENFDSNRFKELLDTAKNLRDPNETVLTLFNLNPKQAINYLDNETVLTLFKLNPEQTIKYLDAKFIVDNMSDSGVADFVKVHFSENIKFNEKYFKELKNAVHEIQDKRCRKKAFLKLISFNPECAIKIIMDDNNNKRKEEEKLLLVNIKKDGILNGIRRYFSNNKNFDNGRFKELLDTAKNLSKPNKAVFTLFKLNPKQAIKYLDAKFIVDNINDSKTIECVKVCFSENNEFGEKYFQKLKNAVHEIENEKYRQKTFLKLVSLNPEYAIKIIMNADNNKREEEEKLLLDNIEKLGILADLEKLCSNPQNDNIMQKIFSVLTKKVLNENEKNKDSSFVEYVVDENQYPILSQKYLAYVNKVNKEESKKKIVNIPEENSYSNGTEIQKWDGSITQYIMAEANSPELKISHDSSKSNLVLLLLMILNMLLYIIRCLKKDTTTEKISTNDINHSDEENRKKENIINNKLKESSSSNDHQCVPTQIKMKKIKIRRL